MIRVRYIGKGRTLLLLLLRLILLVAILRCCILAAKTVVTACTRRIHSPAYHESESDGHSLLLNVCLLYILLPVCIDAMSID